MADYKAKDLGNPVSNSKLNNTLFCNTTITITKQVLADSGPLSNTKKPDLVSATQ